jgi:hypothetical protein
LFLLYFLYQRYRLNLVEIKTSSIIQISYDISHLANNHPLSTNVNYYNNSLISKIYNIHGINSYRDYIYCSNNDMINLCNILNNNPDVHSSFSSIVLQDAIGSNVEVAVDATKQFMKTAFKRSSPLLSVILVIMTINVYESLSSLLVFF